MLDRRQIRVRPDRRTSGAVNVEYVVLLVIFFAVAMACTGLGIVLARSAQRADVILRSNSP